jgi:CelD/BcsL family acetyltransferase involved in cellulose biosynthesis
LLRLRSVGALRERAPAWDELWTQSDGIAPSARADLVADWIEHFAPGAAVEALVVEEQGRFVAALPLYVHTVGRVLPVARLPRNAWAANGALLLDPSVDPAPVLDCLVCGLSRVPAALIWLPLAPTEEPAWEALREAMNRAGMPFLLEEQYRVPQVEIGDDWDAYDRTRESRRNRRRHAQAMERDGGAELEVHTRFAPGELDRLLRLGFEIEDRSWKGRAGTSALRWPGLFEFYCREAHRLAARDELQLVFLKLAGTPVAFSYQWRSRGRQFCVKLGYDEEWRQYGPGQQLMMRQLQQLHGDPGCDLLDFWGRAVGWSKIWATSDYPLCRLVAAPRGLLRRGLFNLYRAARPYLTRREEAARLRHEKADHSEGAASPAPPDPAPS